MGYIKDIAGNNVLLCSLLGWMTAQALKYLIESIKEKDFRIKKLLFTSGGMPSGHSAAVCSLCTSLARSEGMSSPLFATGVVIAFIVMRDAVGVCWAAGEQATALNNLKKQLSEHEPLDIQKELKENIGHRPLEVIIGALVGIAIGLIMPCKFIKPLADYSY